MTPLRVLIVAPSLDGNDIGEVEWAFSWIKALARQADVTVLSFGNQDPPDVTTPTPLRRFEIRF